MRSPSLSSDKSTSNKCKKKKKQIPPANSHVARPQPILWLNNKNRKLIPNQSPELDAADVFSQFPINRSIDSVPQHIHSCPRIAAWLCIYLPQSIKWYVHSFQSLNFSAFNFQLINHNNLLILNKRSEYIYFLFWYSLNVGKIKSNKFQFFVKQITLGSVRGEYSKQCEMAVSFAVGSLCLCRLS